MYQNSKSVQFLLWIVMNTGLQFWSRTYLNFFSFSLFSASNLVKIVTSFGKTLQASQSFSSATSVSPLSLQPRGAGHQELNSPRIEFKRNTWGPTLARRVSASQPPLCCWSSFAPSQWATQTTTLPAPLVVVYPSTREGQRQQRRSRFAVSSAIAGRPTNPASFAN